MAEVATYLNLFSVNDSIYSSFTISISYKMLTRHLSSGPLTTLGGLESISFVKSPFTNQSDDWPDIQLHFIAGSAVADRGRHLRHAIGLSDVVRINIQLQINGGPL